MRESQGDIRKFEYDRIELQMIDLIYPPSQEAPSPLKGHQQKEILIEDILNTAVSQTFTGAKGIVIGGDTSDASFIQGKDPKLSDIAEEDAVSVISENRLHKS